MSRESRERGDLEAARARALAELETRFTQRELERSEYLRRVELARRASSPDELEPLIAGSTHSSLARASPPEPLADPDQRGSVVAILGAAFRRGSWEPPETLQVLSLLGAVDLDLREAEFLEGVTELVVVAVMGSVKVIVPPGADVQSEGFALMGEFSHLQHRSPHPDSPALRVRGVSVMGSVEVKVKG